MYLGPAGFKQLSLWMSNDRIILLRSLLNGELRCNTIWNRRHKHEDLVAIVTGIPEIAENHLPTKPGLSNWPIVKYNNDIQGGHWLFQVSQHRWEATRQRDKSMIHRNPWGWAGVQQHLTDGNVETMIENCVHMLNDLLSDNLNSSYWIMTASVEWHTGVDFVVNLVQGKEKEIKLAHVHNNTYNLYVPVGGRALANLRCIALLSDFYMKCIIKNGRSDDYFCNNNILHQYRPACNGLSMYGPMLHDYAPDRRAPNLTIPLIAANLYEYGIDELVAASSEAAINLIMYNNKCWQLNFTGVAALNFTTNVKNIIIAGHKGVNWPRNVIEVNMELTSLQIACKSAQPGTTLYRYVKENLITQSEFGAPVVAGSEVAVEGTKEWAFIWPVIGASGLQRTPLAQESANALYKRLVNVAYASLDNQLLDGKPLPLVKTMSFGPNDNTWGTIDTSYREMLIDTEQAKRMNTISSNYYPYIQPSDQWFDYTTESTMIDLLPGSNLPITLEMDNDGEGDIQKLLRKYGQINEMFIVACPGTGKTTHCANIIGEKFTDNSQPIYAWHPNDIPERYPISACLTLSLDALIARGVSKQRIQAHSESVMFCFKKNIPVYDVSGRHILDTQFDESQALSERQWLEMWGYTENQQPLPLNPIERDYVTDMLDGERYWMGVSNVRMKWVRHGITKWPVDQLIVDQRLPLLPQSGNIVYVGPHRRHRQTALLMTAGWDNVTYYICHALKEIGDHGDIYNSHIDTIEDWPAGAKVVECGHESHVCCAEHWSYENTMEVAEHLTFHKINSYHFASAKLECYMRDDTEGIYELGYAEVRELVGAHRAWWLEISDAPSEDIVPIADWFEFKESGVETFRKLIAEAIAHAGFGCDDDNYAKSARSTVASLPAKVPLTLKAGRFNNISWDNTGHVWVNKCGMTTFNARGFVHVVGAILDCMYGVKHPALSNIALKNCLKPISEWFIYNVSCCVGDHTRGSCVVVGELGDYYINLAPSAEYIWTLGGIKKTHDRHNTLGFGLQGNPASMAWPEHHHVWFGRDTTEDEHHWSKFVATSDFEEWRYQLARNTNFRHEHRDAGNFLGAREGFFVVTPLDCDVCGHKKTVTVMCAACVILGQSDITSDKVPSVTTSQGYMPLMPVTRYPLLHPQRRYEPHNVYYQPNTGVQPKFQLIDGCMSYDMLAYQRELVKGIRDETFCGLHGTNEAALFMDLQELDENTKQIAAMLKFAMTRLNIRVVTATSSYGNTDYNWINLLHSNRNHITRAGNCYRVECNIRHGRELAMWRVVAAQFANKPTLIMNGRNFLDWSHRVPRFWHTVNEGYNTTWSSDVVIQNVTLSAATLHPGWAGPNTKLLLQMCQRWGYIYGCDEVAVKRLSVVPTACAIIGTIDKLDTVQHPDLWNNSLLITDSVGRRLLKVKTGYNIHQMAKIRRLVA